MKTMLVNGSPHPKGCTFTALSEIASILNEEDVETEVFWIGNRPVGGCIDCRKSGNPDITKAWSSFRRILQNCNSTQS